MLIVYSKNGCPNCVSLITLLDEELIEYKVIKIDEDTEGADFIKKRQHRSVPQVYKEGKLFVEGGYQGILKMWRSKSLKSSL